MPDGSIQQVQVILNTEGFKPAAGGGIELCSRAAVAKIDLVHIAHQIQSLLFADIFIQRSAKIIGNVIFSIRERACSAKAAHNTTAFAADAGFHLLPIDGTAPLAQGMACFKDSNLQLRLPLHQFIGRKNTAGACSNNNDIILHCFSSLSCTALL